MALVSPAPWPVSQAYDEHELWCLTHDPSKGTNMMMHAYPPAPAPASVPLPRFLTSSKKPPGSQRSILKSPDSNVPVPNPWTVDGPSYSNSNTSVSTSDDEEEVKWARAKIKVGRMASMGSPDLHRLLEEAARCLLQQEDRTATLAYLGRQLSTASKRRLRSSQTRLGHVLRCFGLDFGFEALASGMRVVYLHDVIKPSYSLYTQDFL